jgi:hypothetical protein
VQISTNLSNLLGEKSPIFLLYHKIEKKKEKILLVAGKFKACNNSPPTPKPHSHHTQHKI